MCTIEKALSIIKENTSKLEEKVFNEIKVENNFEHIILFEELLMNIIRYKWEKNYPNHFLKCYVVNEDYNSINGAGYSWIMTVINKGNFNNLFDLRKCSDKDVYINGLEKTKNIRKNLANEILNSNISEWVINNIKIT